MKIMKKIQFAIILLMVMLMSCEDVLDKAPLNSLSDEAMWENQSTTQGYVDASYVAVTLSFSGGGNNVLPWGHFFAEGTDEGFSHLPTIGGMDFIASGILTPASPIDIGSWRRFYYYVQHINTFFDNDEAGRLAGDEATLNQWRGEMHFIRAWIYNQLVTAYGGVVLSETAFSTDDLEVDDVRASYDESVQFIVADLDMAIDLLDMTTPSNEAGRANKGIAMALKARVLLYAASELHNPSHDNAKWQAASDAAKTVIDLPQYKLYNPEKYDNIFYDFVSEGNTEVILARHMTGTIGLNFWYNFNTTMFGPVSWGGWGIGAPIQSMVDAFEMADGTPYDRATHGQDPYVNREPRFYANILYDGAQYSEVTPRVPGVPEIGSKVQTGRYIYAAGDTTLGYDRYGGALKEPGNATRTGYYCHKYVRDDADIVFYRDHMQSIFMRLSEMYLNYAECQMELGNADMARQYIEPIRNRVGLPTPSTITMDDIRHERRIELAFEAHRFWDVRRWKILDQTVKDAEKVEVLVDYTVDPPVTTYEYGVFQKRNYNEAYYYLPIPEKERTKNPLLTQNPGYTGS
jgi:hypothetical protein